MNAWVERRWQQTTRGWDHFWHEPVAAERLALMRALVGLALLTDQLLQYLPFWGYLFGPHGTGTFALNESWMTGNWRWPVLFFSSESQWVLGACFFAWVLSALALVVGFRTRSAAVVAWVLTQCFFARNTNVKNGGDDIAQIALFWLMFAPSQRALSWDSRHLEGPQKTAPWAVRLLQVQVCMMYTATGIAKLKGGPDGTWLSGTSLHYVYNDIGLVRWSFADLPMPIWITAPAGYVALFWEVLFIPLVLIRRTRRFALIYGLLFHIVIYLSLEVGWFSFYAMALYPIWLSDRFCEQQLPVWREQLGRKLAHWRHKLLPATP